MTDDNNRLVRLPVPRNDGGPTYDIFVGSRYVAIVEPLGIVRNTPGNRVIVTRLVLALGNKSEMHIIDLPCEEVVARLGKESP